MSRKAVVDSRGYVAAERNRVLTRAQVVWARKAAFEQGASAREISDALQRVGIDMGLESVRRMLRGETYRNVGAQLPQAGRFQAPADEGDLELVAVSDEEAAASGERLAALLAVDEAAPADPSDILRRFAADVDAEKGKTGDALLAELGQADDPFGEPAAPAASGK